MSIEYWVLVQSVSIQSDGSTLAKMSTKDGSVTVHIRYGRPEEAPAVGGVRCIGVRTGEPEPDVFVVENKLPRPNYE